MDNLTHTLAALALSQTGLNRKTRFATVTLIIGANLPDVDLVAGLGGSATYLQYHRGITHSLFGAAILASVLAALIYFLGRTAPPGKKPGPPLNARWLLAISGIALASHLLMDFTNSYGMRPALPFSARWYAWDIMPIIDPLLLVLLLMGLGLPPLFRLISEEMGAKKTRPRWGAYFALGAMLTLWAVRDLAHRRVLGFIDSHTYREETPLRTGAFPIPINPFAWTSVVETDSAFHVLTADALGSDVDADHTFVHHKPETTPALAAAMQTRTALIFANFARFLWPKVEETENGSLVTLVDLRYASLTVQRQAFVVEIELDKNLKVLSESFYFVTKARP